MEYVDCVEILIDENGRAVAITIAPGKKCKPFSRSYGPYRCIYPKCQKYVQYGFYRKNDRFKCYYCDLHYNIVNETIWPKRRFLILALQELIPDIRAEILKIYFELIKH